MLIERVGIADASAILLTDNYEKVLFANDTEQVEAAGTNGIECWWVTTLLLKSTKTISPTADEMLAVLYGLGRGHDSSSDGQRVQRKFRELGDGVGVFGQTKRRGHISSSGWLWTASATPALRGVFIQIAVEIISCALIPNVDR